MTHAPDKPRLARAESEIVSWILLFGVIPMERHRIRRFASDQEGRWFHESSSNLLMRRWIHWRSVRAENGRSRLVDRCAFEPRVRCMGPVLLLIYRATFAHRHRRLRGLQRRGLGQRAQA